MDISNSAKLINDLTYDDYVNDCLLNGSEPMPIDDFNDVKSGKALRFINPGMVGNLGRLAANVAIKNSDKLIAAAQEGPSKLSKVSMELLKEEGMNKAKSILFDGKSSIGGDGGSNSGSGGNSSSGSNNPNNLLGDYAVNPLKMDFKPGIKNRSYTSVLNDPTPYYATTHLTGYKVQIPDDNESNFYFNNVLVPWLQQAAQSAVGFRVDFSILTAANIKQYLNDVLNALNIVYFYTSVLSYAAIPSNRDMGMLNLRSMISASDIDYLLQLKQLLGGLPIPPNLNTLAFFMNQTFADAEDGDGIFKFVPIPFKSSTTDTVTAFADNSFHIVSAIGTLNSSNNRQVASILIRVSPSWINPIIYDPASVPVFSKTALTVFANCYHRYFSGSANFLGPILPDQISTWAFLSFDSNLDGAALALSSAKLSSPDQNMPSIGTAVSTNHVISGANLFSNRYSYVSSGGNLVWRVSNANIESAFGRQERSRAYLATNYYAKLPGSFRLTNLNVNTVNESAKDLLSWMCSINMIQKQQKSGGWSKGKSKNPKKDKPKSAEAPASES